MYNPGDEINARTLVSWHHAPYGDLRTKMMELLKVTALFFVTAVAEILGCYLPWLAVREGKSDWLILPGALSLGVFSWLLTLHPAAAGRTYAAYGGVYIVVALLWLRVVEGINLTRWDLSGAALALAGMAIMAMQPAT